MPIKFENTLCVLCNTCLFVCPANAICIEKTAQTESMYDFTLWHNSCTLCGNCIYYCPSGALRMSDETTAISLQEHKYTHAIHANVSLTTCSSCGKEMVALSDSFLHKAFGHTSTSLEEHFRLCPTCRRTHTFSQRVLNP
ncbi:4Fe-4S dicluster domain-containing protein [Sulfurospirillum deleyianum]|uniref:4Fe-4S ferredoxin iron-sulfur binding domain protein n=1 Tax=Sulfurospirillum deleyianum (strain ATCC 51133 / DSM 6946 / 5175) TaxID=525898 RepID=D1B298_SULD5|nr:4Fe-4S dicluster domain-containing protein [Sulfurospirillum deleyianum]ACZ12218.1 4Fe-4S ferredoxin iron-sulfur binding domain protein [Sulfurospirillum deleyianum DSM 6946]